MSNRNFKFLRGFLTVGCASLLFLDNYKFVIIFCLLCGAIEALLIAYRRDAKMSKQERERCITLKQLFFGIKNTVKKR